MPPPQQDPNTPDQQPLPPQKVPATFTAPPLYYTIAATQYKLNAMLSLVALQFCFVSALFAIPIMVWIINPHGFEILFADLGWRLDRNYVYSTSQGVTPYTRVQDNPLIYLGYFTLPLTVFAYLAARLAPLVTARLIVKSRRAAQCPRCSYLIQSLGTSTCPECGLPLEGRVGPPPTQLHTQPNHPTRYFIQLTPIDAIRVRAELAIVSTAWCLILLFAATLPAISVISHRVTYGTWDWIEPGLLLAIFIFAAPAILTLLTLTFWLRYFCPSPPKSQTQPSDQPQPETKPNPPTSQS